MKRQPPHPYPPGERPGIPFLQEGEDVNYSQSEHRVTSIMPYYGLTSGPGKWNSMAFDISVPGHVVVFPGRDVENVGWFPSIIPEGQVRLGEFWLVVDPWA